MNKQTQEVISETGQLADDARALMAATADVPGEKVSEARKRLTAALDRAKEIAGRAREKAVQGAKAVDETVHDHPYQAMAIALVVGAAAGYLWGSRGSRRD
jgi:ElaB/YqjD/DUF883 family membrane-anchored ribosome-binding protein